MRILGVSKKDWINYLTDKPKLEEDTFTTFRFTRRDIRDWEVGELVQIVYKPRSKGGGERLGVAEIIGKEKRWVISIPAHNSLDENFRIDNILLVSNAEAQVDGFADRVIMAHWMLKTHKREGEMNKLTLRWVERSKGG